jgi:uncharacterized membrane-anchored protein
MIKVVHERRTRLADMIGRLPRVLLFAAAALVQIGLVAAMVFDRARILHDGTEVKLLARPIDPRDLLRGDYVVLSYAISVLPAGELKGRRSDGRRPVIYVKLAPNAEGYYDAVSVHDDRVPVTGREVLIQGHVTSGTGCGGSASAFCDRLTINYGIERYFVPEGHGREIEKERNEGRIAVIAAVTATGRAAVKRLLLDDMPLYDEPLF